MVISGLKADFKTSEGVFLGEDRPIRPQIEAAAMKMRRSGVDAGCPERGLGEREDFSKKNEKILA
jgi:hypothetical protein